MDEAHKKKIVCGQQLLARYKYTITTCIVYSYDNSSSPRVITFKVKQFKGFVSFTLCYLKIELQIFYKKTNPKTGYKISSTMET